MRMPNMVAEVLKMRMLGMSPLQARQQLAQMYPQLGQNPQFMQAKTPQEMDGIARNMAQSMGMNPQQMIQSVMKK